MSFGIPVRNGLAVGLLASTFLSSRRTAYPAMSLNFLAPFLDSRITFSRGSNATLVDATGKITYAPANLLTYSGFEGTVVGTPGTNPTNWPFNSAGGSITSFASGVIGFSATAARQIIGQTVSLGPNERQVWSVTVVTNPNALVANQLFMVINGTGATAIFYANGVVVDQNFYVPQANDRLSYSIINGGTALTPIFRIGVGATSNATGSASFTQPQLEPVTYRTTPSTYVATTASAYYGPRFDYDPVTLAPKGLLIEEARTNLLTYSEQFDNAAWVKTNTTVTANATTSPDGTTNADKVVEDTSTSTHFVRQPATVVTSTTYTYSVYLKASERGFAQVRYENSGSTQYFAANVNLSTGAVTTASFGSPTGTSASATNAGNGWWRVNLTVTASDTIFQAIVFSQAVSGTNSYTGDGTSGIFIYGAQLEAGSFATSYIPTVASQVTRTADQTSIVAPNFAPWFNPSEGTFVFSGDSAYGGGGMIGSTPTTGAILYSSSFDAKTFNGTSTVTAANTYTKNAVFNTALGYSASGRAIVLNGGTVASDANLIQTPTAITLGGAFGGGYLNGHIRSIRYYPTRLSNAQLQALTA